MVGLQTPTMTGADTVAKNESLNAAAKAKVLSRWRGLAEPVEYLHDQGELLSLLCRGARACSQRRPLKRNAPLSAGRPSRCPLRPRRRPHRYLGPGQPRHDVVLPAHAAPGGHVGDQLVLLGGAAERHRLAALAGAVLARHPIRPSARRARRRSARAWRGKGARSGK